MSGQEEPRQNSEYEYTVNMIDYHSLHECEYHPESWNKITQTNRQVCCWTCISKAIYQHFQDKQNICETCFGFVCDWLDLPLHETDVFYTLQNTKALKRIAPWFANELLKLVPRIGDLDKRILNSSIHQNIKKLDHELHDCVVHEELLWSTATLKSFMESPFYDELQYIIDILIDAHVCKDIDDTAIFTAFWFWKVWTAVPTIHKEHIGEAPVSYAGPALGMTPNPLPIPSPNVKVNNPSESNMYPLPFPLIQEQQRSSGILVEEE